MNNVIFQVVGTDKDCYERNLIAVKQLKGILYQATSPGTCSGLPLPSLADRLCDTGVNEEIVIKHNMAVIHYE